MDKILYIDDEDIQCRLMTEIFKSDKYHVDTSSCYKNAIEMMDKNNYDLIISDINLPGKNGIDILKDVKNRNKNAYVILITGAPSLNTAVDAIRFGAFEYILKPYDIIDLVNIVQKALDEKKVSDEVRHFQSISEKYQENLEKTLMDQIYEIRNAYKMAKSAHIKSLEILARAAEYHDQATNYHIKLVGEYSAVIAQHMGLAEEEVNLIRFTAPMHDVGKIGISHQILRKPGKLTDEEFGIVQMHTIIGANIFGSESHPYHKSAGIIAVSHHERYNGDGYPFQLSGEDIPLFGRIVSIVDVYDALTSERPYKDRWSIEKASKYILEQRGQQFDPNIVDCFFDAIGDINNARERVITMTDEYMAREPFSYYNYIKENNIFKM